ncbi:hypothetical protein ACP4OV_016373 [Aristida adscensionis]
MAPYYGNRLLVIAAALTLVALNVMTDRVSDTLAAREPSTSAIDEEAMKARHETWMTEHGRTYKDEAEKTQRFRVFKANVDSIDSSNAAGKKYHLAINKFADMSNDEFIAMYTGFKPMPSRGKKLSGFKYENFTLSDIPQAVDWTKKGAVTKIKDQKQCGCCWAFSTVGAVEGIHQIMTGQLQSLSAQQLVDCSTNNHGCQGGNMDIAFQYIVDNGGIATEDAYPYKATQSMCQSVQPSVKIRGHQDVPQDNEDALAMTVANQPVSVGIDAKSTNFQFYHSGVMPGDGCGTEMTHAVTAVGYGSAQNGGQYWLLKNQWGEDWGERGYMRLERGTGACGVAKMASYPVA